MNSKKCCVYKLMSISNPNKIYIGSTAYFPKRKARHFSDLKKGIHPNTILQNHANKYSVEDIKIEIIENVEDVNNLIIREQYYIDELKPIFNIRKIAESNLGIKRTEAFRKKQSENNARYWKNKTRSIETKEKISKAKTGVKIHTEKHKLTLYNRMLGNKINLGRKITTQIIEKRKISFYQTIEKRRKTKLNKFKLSLPKLKIYRRIFNGEIQNNLVREYKVCKKTIQRIRLYYEKEIDYTNCVIKT